MGPFTDECSGQEMAKEREYFAHTDGRKANNVRSAREAMPLERLVTRVELLTSRMSNEIGCATELLSGHADRVHGPVPEDDLNRVRSAEDYGPGMLDHLFRAMDNLEHQYAVHIERLNFAVARSTTLA